MGCGCKGSSYETPSTPKVPKEPRKATIIDASYYNKPAVYNGPQPKLSKD